MGRISQQLATGFNEAHERAGAEQELSGLARDVPDFQTLLGELRDPVHAAYVMAQNLTSLFAEGVSELEEFDEYAGIIGEAEEEYRPDGPPISPLTRSYFTTWAFFDMPFGPDGETIGTCLLDLTGLIGMEEFQAGLIRNYQESRMGIYEHCGDDGSLITLRELVTGEEFACHPTSGYRGRQGQLWYVRLCPPIAELTDYFEQLDYHLALTTPYILTNASVTDWTAYLRKNLKAGRPVEQALHEFLKFGPERYHWHEFVFQAYSGYQFDAIFLTGLPDVKSSLPHAM